MMEDTKRNSLAWYRVPSQTVPFSVSHQGLHFLTQNHDSATLSFLNLDI